MIMTKKTVMTWTTNEAKNLSEQLNTERFAFLDSMLAENKTDKIVENPTPTTTIRYWADLAAATEWKQWLESAANKYSVGLLVSVTIEDI